MRYHFGSCWDRKENVICDYEVWRNVPLRAGLVQSRRLVCEAVLSSVE